MKTTQEILARVRDLLPELKELKFGCEVKHKKRGIARYVGLNKRVKNLWFDNEDEPIYTVDIGGNSEIIGLPVELPHLLHGIMIANDFMKPTRNQLWNIIQKYDLTKSLEQNLDTNEQLRELISNLI